MIAELASQGLAILLISSELPELIGMCDRIVVLREGRQTATFTRAEADAERVTPRSDGCGTPNATQIQEAVAANLR